MSGGTIGFILFEVIPLSVGAVMLCFPKGRVAFVKALLELRRMYVVIPLRLITGRRRPDYWRIRELERELLDR